MSNSPWEHWWDAAQSCAALLVPTIHLHGNLGCLSRLTDKTCIKMGREWGGNKRLWKSLPVQARCVDLLVMPGSDSAGLCCADSAIPKVFLGAFKGCLDQPFFRIPDFFDLCSFIFIFFTSQLVLGMFLLLH